MEAQNTNTNTSPRRTILVTNYRRKNDSDDPKKTIGDFFAFCGGIHVLELVEDPDKKDYYKAHITFETPAAAEVAQLLNTAVIGHESEQIKVELVETPAHHTSGEATATLETPQTPSGVIEKLLSLGYKLKDDALHLAKQIDNTIRTTAAPTIQTASTVIAAHIPETIKEASTTAYAATAHTLQDATLIAKDITGNVISNTVVMTEDLKNKGHAAAVAATTTLQTATGATVGAFTTVGQAITNTSQVTLDVTTHTLQQVAENTINAAPVPVQQGIHTATDAIKTAGNVVSNTSHLAYDVADNKFHEIANATIESSQVAAATIASVYEANKAPIVDVQNRAVNLVSTGGEVLKWGGEVAAATVTSLYEANKSTVSNIVSSGGETIKNTTETAYNVASTVAAGATATISSFFSSPAGPQTPPPSQNQ